MLIRDFPNELVLITAETLGARDLYSLIRVSRRFASLLSPSLRATTLKAHNSRPALYWAVLSGDRRLARYVLEKGTVTVIESTIGATHIPWYIRSKVLHQAPGECDDAKLELIMSHGVNLLLQSKGDYQPPSFPIMWAIKRQHYALLKLALEKHSQPRIHKPDYYREYDRCHRSAVSHAAKCGDERAVEMLVDHGFKPDGDSRNLSPLLLATGKDHVGTVKMLLKKGASIKAKNRKGERAFSIAERRNHKELAMVLLEHSILNNIPSPDYGSGRPAIYIATKYKKVELVKYLLDRGVGTDINFVDKYGDTALDIAVRSAVTVKDEEIVRLLLEKGATLDRRSGSSNSILHMAVLKACPGIVRMLLAYGADINAKNEEGLSPLELAARYPQMEIMKILQEAGAKFVWVDPIGLGVRLM